MFLLKKHTETSVFEWKARWPTPGSKLAELKYLGSNPHSAAARARLTREPMLSRNVQQPPKCSASLEERVQRSGLKSRTLHQLTATSESAPESGDPTKVLGVGMFHTHPASTFDCVECFHLDVSMNGRRTLGRRLGA